MSANTTPKMLEKMCKTELFQEIWNHRQNEINFKEPIKELKWEIEELKTTRAEILGVA